METEESILKKNDKTPKPDVASINNPVAKVRVVYSNVVDLNSLGLDPVTS